MSALVGLFLNNILPILLIAATGFIIGRTLQVDPRALSRIIFYIFSPSLLFTLITKNQLVGDDILRMIALAVIHTLLMGGLTWAFGRLLKLERRLLIAVVLTVMFMNAGNYGLSLNSFAFGDAALAYASIFFATMGVLTYILGVLIASSGKYRLKDALINLFKLPILYALVLAFIILGTGWTVPLPLDRTINLLGQAAIPAMLVLLGLQLQRAKWDGKVLGLVLSNTARLVVSPLIALVLVGLLGLQGTARQAAVSETAMPTAVMVTVLATEYDVEPIFVTTVVFTSTVLSPLTLTPLLAYLGA